MRVRRCEKINAKREARVSKENQVNNALSFLELLLAFSSKYANCLAY